MQQPLEMSGTPPAAARRLPSTTPWLGVGMVVIAGVVAALQVGKVAIAVPQLRADFGLDLSMVGWLMAMFSLWAHGSRAPAIGACCSRGCWPSPSAVPPVRWPMALRRCCSGA
jgi:hypothetical protein